MLILLPPSEGKTAGSGAPIQLENLSFPQLNELRNTVATALIEVSSRLDALEILGVGSRIADEVYANTQLWTLPTAPAYRIYSGVLYQAAHLSDPDIRPVARQNVRIISALWGALTPEDQIPAYRLSMTSALPGIGKLATLWKPELSKLFAEEIVVDCCSAAYQKAWHPAKNDPYFAQIAQVKAVKGGRVVSHWAKHYRGVLCRKLLQSGSRQLDQIQSLEELAQLADSLLAPEARVSLQVQGKTHYLVIELPD